MMNVHCLYYQSKVQVFSKNYTAKMSVWQKYRKVVPSTAILGPEVCPSNTVSPDTFRQLHASLLHSNGN